MAHALVHILGSRSGYTTLDATAGLTSGDRAELEVLGFGDATSSEAMARLETHACMVGRRLRSGRFAISRMLPGGTDDKGRPTIEVVSLVLDASGYAAVAGALGRLADDVRFWRLARGAVARGYELPEQTPVESAREPGVLRAFDTWVAARKTGSVGVLATQDAPSLMAMVALLDGQDLGECRWGIGIVSLSAPVDICTLAPSTAAIGSRPVLRAATGASWLSPEMAHVEFHVAQNPLLPPRASLVSAVRIEPALDRDAEATPVAAAATGAAMSSWRPRSQKRNLTLIAAITAVASLAVLVMTTAVYVRTGRAVNVAVDESSSETPGAPQASAATVEAGGSSNYAERAPQSTQPVDGKTRSDVEPDPQAGLALAPSPSAGNTPRSTLDSPPPDRDQDGEPDATDCAPEDSSRSEYIVYYADFDHDTKGDPKSPGKFCLNRKDPLPDDHVANAEDDCPENTQRSRAGKCGCDYPQESEDCDEDDDGDGETNRTDRTDDRVELLRSQVKPKLRNALEALIKAEEIHASIRSKFKKNGVDPVEAKAVQTSLEQSMERLEACLDYIYQARVCARFGDLSFNPISAKDSKRYAANVMAVASKEDFADLIAILERFPQMSREFMNVNLKMAGMKRTEGKQAQGWRDQLEEKLRLVHGESYEKSVGDWVCSFIAMSDSMQKLEIDQLRRQCQVKEKR